jgi:hypothetical protein
MGILRPGDEEIHYSDGSHRWVGPEPDQDDVWRARVLAHLDEHRRTLDGGRPARVRATRHPDRPST